jgi:multiple sugar transport system ATP-binding protein
MNMLRGRLVGGNGAIYFDEGSDRILLRKDLGERVSRYLGQEVVLGVRPENLSDRNDGGFAGQENVLHVKVSVVEPLGDKMDVYVSTSRHDHLICRVDSHSQIREGQALAMHLDMSRVHIFEPGDAGVNVSLSGNGAASSA